MAKPPDQEPVVINSLLPSDPNKRGHTTPRDPYSLLHIWWEGRGRGGKSGTKAFIVVSMGKNKRQDEQL